MVAEVLRFEDLTIDRCAVVRWTDQTESRAMSWHSDEVMWCGGDFLGKTEDQLRSLLVGRDRDWPQS